MDKFGIFNILSSLINFSTTQKADSEHNQTQNLENPPPIKDTESNPNTQAITPEIKKISPQVSVLLNTIHSHDAFIKRVKQNNKK